jgi:hypothetical protein
MAGESRKRNVTAIATNTTLSFPGHNGAFITNEGATGAVTLTVPAGTEALRGCWFEVYVSVDQSVTVATAVTDTLAVDGDVSADSIGWVTSSHKVGNSARFTCLGAGTAGSVSAWVCQLMPAATTTTIATQTIVTA